MFVRGPGAGVAPRSVLTSEEKAPHLNTDYRLPTTDYRLSTTDYRLPTTDYRLPTTDYRLPTTDCPQGLPLREIRLSVTGCLYASGMLSEDGVLSERDVRVLDFEGSWWLYPQPKDRAIKDYLGMSATRYYQVLRRLVDDEQALAYASMTVRRLRRLQRSRLGVSASQAGDGDGAR